MTAPTRLLIFAIAGTMLIPGFATARNGGSEDGSRTAVTASPTPKSSNKATESPEVHKAEVEASEAGDDSPHPTRLPDPTPKVKIDQTQFCSKFTDATSTVSSETITRFNELNTNFAARGAKISSDFTDAATQIAKSRADADAQLNAKLAELAAKATTDDQKTAVAEYKTAVLAAVAARRAAVDAADTVYRAGLQAAVADRQTLLKTAATDYKTAVAAALAAAKSSCAAGTNPQTVRANLKNALDAARAKLSIARQGASKNGPDLSKLKSAHTAALNQANNTFKAAIKVALTNLRAALGVTATASPSPTVTP